jgi:hypothetical protein
MKEQLQARLLTALQGIDFDRRYYDFWEKTRTRMGKPFTIDPAQLADVVGKSGLAFTFDKKEKFYRHDEKGPDYLLKLHIAFPASTVECGLYLVASATIGGPYPRLARLIGEQRDPSFSPEPPSPKLPYTNLDELGEAVQFGCELFIAARDAIAAAGPW